MKGPVNMLNEPQSSPADAQWSNKAELARHYRCSIRHINSLMNRRVLPFLKIGRFVRFDLAACDRAMSRYQTRPLLS
jgi:hypothetical protein